MDAWTATCCWCGQRLEKSISCVYPQEGSPRPEFEASGPADQPGGLTQAGVALPVSRLHPEPFLGSRDDLCPDMCFVGGESGLSHASEGAVGGCGRKARSTPAGSLWSFSQWKDPWWLGCTGKKSQCPVDVTLRGLPPGPSSGGRFLLQSTAGLRSVGWHLWASEAAPASCWL